MVKNGYEQVVSAMAWETANFSDFACVRSFLSESHCSVFEVAAFTFRKILFLFAVIFYLGDFCFVSELPLTE